MNLGQMIDPEWVYERFRERLKPRRRDAEPEQTTTRQGGRMLEVLRVLAFAGMALGANEIRILLGDGTDGNDARLYALLGYAVEKGYARREGRPFKYRITEAGRARLG